MTQYNESQDFKKLFDAANTIAVVSHRKPDGDAVGANLALSMLAENMGKHAISFCADTPSEDLHFLPRLERFTSDASLLSTFPLDLVVSVDGGDLVRMGLETIVRNWSNPKPLRLVNIDHHAANDHFGDINIVDSSAASTTFMLYRIIQEWGVEITPDIATCLLCGIMTDTGSFSNLATTAEAMQVSSELLGLGARMKEVVKNTFQNQSLRSLKLWGKAFTRLKRDPETGVVTTLITQRDLEELQADDEDISGVTNFLNTLEDAEMVIMYVQMSKDTIRASLRTTRDGCNVLEIASKHGGGGHRKAAGFECRGRVEEARHGWNFVPSSV